MLAFMCQCCFRVDAPNEAHGATTTTTPTLRGKDEMTHIYFQVFDRANIKKMM